MSALQCTHHGTLGVLEMSMCEINCLDVDAIVDMSDNKGVFKMLRTGINPFNIGFFMSDTPTAPSN